MTRGRARRGPARRIALTGTAALLGAGIAVLLAGACSRRLGTSTVPVRLPGLDPAFDGFRILQISDLHDTAFGHDQAELLEAVDRAAPDLVVLTGDILDRGTRDLRPLLDLAGRLVARAPVMAVTGNHEGGSSRGPQLMAGLEARGVQVLRDASADLRRGTGRLRIIGIDDPRVLGGPPSSRSSPPIDARLAGEALGRAGIRPRSDGPAPGEAAQEPAVLLAHRPELLAVYAAHGVDLVLSGHAHGGQWRLPGLGGLYAPNQGVLPALTAGVHAHGPTRMVVSRGLKVRRHLPRIANRPELVLVVLRRGAADGPGAGRSVPVGHQADPQGV